jgi:rsbT co-antagonist protein RsbR
VSEAPSELLRELVAHLRQNRTQLREEWVGRISETRLLTAMTKEEIFAEATSVYDSYVEALETETFEALQAYARNLSERIIPRGLETHEVVGIVLLLRDVLARSLFAKYQTDFRKLNRILDAYEPAANRIANTVAVGFVQERTAGGSGTRCFAMGQLAPNIWHRDLTNVLFSLVVVFLSAADS